MVAATSDSSSELDRDEMDGGGARGADDVDSARWDGIAGLRMWPWLGRATDRRKVRAKSGRRRAVATVRVDNMARGHRLRPEDRVWTKGEAGVTYTDVRA